MCAGQITSAAWTLGESWAPICSARRATQTIGRQLEEKRPGREFIWQLATDTSAITLGERARRMRAAAKIARKRR